MENLIYPFKPMSSTFHSKFPLHTFSSIYNFSATIFVYRTYGKNYKLLWNDIIVLILKTTSTDMQFLWLFLEPFFLYMSFEIASHTNLFVNVQWNESFDLICNVIGICGELSREFGKFYCRIDFFVAKLLQKV